MANLYDVLMALIDKRTKRPAGTAPTTADDLYQAGSVVALNGDGTYEVKVNGRTMTANPETDLPLAVGQNVNVSIVRNGKPVVHGPR